MVRVPAPPWAPEHARGKVTFEEADAKHYGSILPAERGTLIERRADVLALVDAQVEKYANDGCCPPGPGGDWFPKQVRLIGEFYIGRERYFKRLHAISCEVLVEARCLARGAAGPEDYLGLHIWLSYDPADGRLWAHHVDSMVI